MRDTAMYHRPTLLERIWRKLGYRYHRNDLPDDAASTHPGWMLTTCVFRFSLADRLRLLVSGRLHIDIRQATTPQVDSSINAASHWIKYPGEK